MNKGSLPVNRSFGDRGQDEEIRRLHKRLDALESGPSASASSLPSPPSQVTVTSTPNGPAGGDLADTYPNPTVAQLQQVAVSNVTPTDQQQLVYVGADTQWEAANLAVGGDLTGTLPNPTLKNTGPGAIGPIGDSTHIAIVTIDAQGRITALTSLAVVCNNIQGVAVSATAPTNGQVLTYNGTSHQWEPT
jgi:trimeric autotransporter adhesin